MNQRFEQIPERFPFLAAAAEFGHRDAWKTSRASVLLRCQGTAGPRVWAGDTHACFWPQTSAGVKEASFGFDVRRLSFGIGLVDDVLVIWRDPASRQGHVVINKVVSVPI